MNKSTKVAAIAYALLLGTTLVACKQKGPVEQAGEEIDEAIDTAKHGKESTANKLDDAADDVRKGVNNAADEVKSK